MTTENQTSIRFSLKESIWFQKGQEPSELISISLYPDIEINEREYEVVVKGALLLTGEYVAEEEKEEPEPFSLRELAPVRTFDSIYIREDGISELSHAFPLEISIPRARVQEVENLYVTVESFDYELPEVGCLQLIADLSIGGLREVVTREEEVINEQEEEEVSLSSHEYEQEEEEVSLSSHEYEREEEEVSLSSHEHEREEEEISLSSHKYKTEEEDISIPAHETEYEEDLFKPFELEERKEPQEIPSPPAQEHAPQFQWYHRKEAVAEKTESETKEEEAFESSPRDENALYLTKLFTKEREEEFTKLRIYFVQQGDTIESITERYDITVQQLTRLNNLDDLYVQEGEILYIPIPKAINKQ